MTNERFIFGRIIIFPSKKISDGRRMLSFIGKTHNNNFSFKTLKTHNVNNFFKLPVRWCPTTKLCIQATESHRLIFFIYLNVLCFIVFSVVHNFLYLEFYSESHAYMCIYVFFSQLPPNYMYMCIIFKNSLIVIKPKVDYVMQ